MLTKYAGIVALIALCIAVSPSWALKFQAAFDPIIVASTAGSVVNRTFTLTLAADEQQTQFKLHLEDWWRSEDGKQTLYREPGIVPRSCGRWITVDPVEQRVNPGQSLTARLSITIPADVKTGGYWCALTVDEVPNPEAIKPTGIGIHFNTSISIPVFVFISPIDRAAKFLDVQVTDATAAVKLQNTGDCPLLISGRFEFLHPGDKTPIAVVPISLGALFLTPVATRIFTEALPSIEKLPSGRYLVRVILDIGLDQYLGVQKVIDVTRK